MRFTSFLLLSAALTLTTTAVQSQTPSTPPSKSTSWNGTKLSLSNGMQLIVVENQEIPDITWSLTLDYPAFLEGNQAGLKRVVSSMMAAGSAKHSEADIAQQIEALNASFEASATGFTASSTNEHSGDLLRLVSDVVLNPTFSQEALDRVMAELQSEVVNTPLSIEAVASNLVSATTFGPFHPYGEVMTEESLNPITREDLVRYHKTYFRPNVAFLTVVGDITPDEAYAKANAHFGKWHRGDIPYTRIMPAKYPVGNQVHFSSLAGSTTSLIRITQPVPFPPSHPDAPAIDLMNVLLGGGERGGRLAQSLQDSLELAVEVGSTLASDPVSAQFCAFGVAQTSTTESALAEFLAEIKRIRDAEVDSFECIAAKAFLAQDLQRKMAEPLASAELALNLARHGLPQDFYTSYLEKLETVTPQDIRRVAQNMLKPNNLNICVVGEDGVLDGLRGYDSSGGIDQHDAFGRVYIPRTEAPEGTTVEQVLNRHFEAIGGAKAWGKLSGLTTVGSVEFQGGMSLQYSESKRFSKKNPAVRMELAMSGQPVSIRCVEANQGREFHMGETKSLDPDAVTRVLDYLSPTRLERLEKNGFTGTVLGQEEVAGQPCVILEFTREDVTETYWFRIADGLLIQQRRLDPEGLYSTESMDQYIPLGDLGLKLPATVVSIVAGQTRIVRIAAATFNPEFAPDAFEWKP